MEELSPQDMLTQLNLGVTPGGILGEPESLVWIHATLSELYEPTVANALGAHQKWDS